MKISNRTQVYFDCNATTPVLPVAAKAALETMQNLYGNPSSSHLVGLQARHILESTRKTAAQVIQASPNEIIFTSGATEALQLAILSALQANKNNSNKNSLSKKKLLYGATEHKAVPEALYHWVRVLDLPYEVVPLPVDKMGQIKLEVLEKEIDEAALLCTMAVNNETGVIQNLLAIENLLLKKSSQALWLVDCVQALGKINLRLDSTRINYAAFSGHKLYAPKGIGFLFVKKDSPLTPLIVGGGQESGLRSGTENLPGVAAFGSVLQLLLHPDATPFHPHSELRKFQEMIVSELKTAFPKIVFNTPFEKSVPTTVNFSIPGFGNGELLDLFDSAGLRVSAGSACNSASVTPSHVLEAMGVPMALSTSALRLSFGPCSTEKEIEKGCKIIRECAIALKNTCLLETTGSFEAPENLRDGIVQFRAGSTNSWVLANLKNRNCVIIDPCETVAERLVNYVRCQNLSVLAILDTHSHGDHESIRPTLQEILADRISRSEIKSHDLSLELGWPSGGPEFQVKLDNQEVVPAISISSEIPDKLGKGYLVLAKVKTPGHTDDSHALLFGFATSRSAENSYGNTFELHKENIGFVFSGDTILSGGLGRTNFSASNPEGLFYSLRNLQTILDSSTLICPAHDYNFSFGTSLKTELQENPLLHLALSPMTPLTLQLFLDRKSQIDKELASLEESFQGVVCGVTQNLMTQRELAITVPANRIQEYLKNKNSHPIIIDVREPQEFSLFKNWKSLGLPEKPRNIPLSRFVNFMGELLHSSQRDQEILIICRSGGRSLQAAKSLRRLGFTHVWNLEGGVSLATGKPEI